MPPKKVENVTMEIMAFGDVEMFTRPCVDCGQITGSFCDHCFAKDRIDDEQWAENQHTPLCTACDENFKMCHFCRGLLWARQPAWPCARVSVGQTATESRKTA